MIAKHMAARALNEPFVFVINRKYSLTDGNTEEVAALSTDSAEIKALEEMGRTFGSSVLLVTSETKTGNTLKRVRDQLPELQGKIKTYAFLYRGGTVKPDHSTIKSMHRGLLPWPDSPEREQHSNGDDEES